MKEYKLFIQRIGLVAITNILTTLSSFILLIILTKNISINEYGVWVQINTTISLIPQIATLGLPYAMIRFLSPEKNLKKIREGFYSILVIILIISITISIVALIFSQNISAALLNGENTLAILLVIMIFFACINAYLINFFRTLNQIKKYSLFLLIQTYLTILIIIYFYLTEGINIYNATFSILIAYLITFISMMSFILLTLGITLPKFQNLKEYLSYGVPIIPHNLSYWIVDSSDRYLIGLILGIAFVGYYSPAYALGALITMIAAPFSFLLPSVLPKYYEEKNLEKVRKFLKYSLKYYLIIAIPCVFGISLLSKPILMIITTSQIALNGYYITPFVAIGALIYGIYGNIANVSILKKQTKTLGLSWFIAALFNIIFNILLIPYMGIVGAAITTLLAYLVAFSINMFTLRDFNFDFDYILMLKCLISSIIMSIIIICINPTGILMILVTIALCSLIYLILMFAFGCIQKDELIFIKNLTER